MKILGIFQYTLSIFLLGVVVGPLAKAISVKELKETYEVSGLEAVLDDGKNILMRECEAGNEEAVKALLNAQVNLNTPCKDIEGKTALIFAAEKGHTGCVKLLLDAGADAEKKCLLDEKTALSYASQNGHSACLELLLKHKVNINQKDVDGKTALMYACIAGHLPCVKLLMKYKAKTNIKDKDGRTALMYSCLEGKQRVFSYLLEAGVRS